MRFLRLLLRLLTPNASPGAGEWRDQTAQIERETRAGRDHPGGASGA